MMNSLKWKRSALALIILMLCLTLGACRPSPILHDIEYTQDASQVDPEVEMEEPDLDAEEETEDFNQEQNYQAETPRDTSRSTGIFGAKGNAQKSVEAKYSANETNDLNTPEAPGQQAENETAPEASGGSTDIPENTGGGKTYKQIVDGRGETVEVPENAEHVTAVGAAAQMVEMLGGSGRLIGTNNDLLAGIAGAVFSDASSIANWWDGDGSLQISDEAFAQLVTSAPDVCFEISGQNTFSDSQVAQLGDAGIAYVVLPALSSVDNLKHSVNIVAQVMGGDAESVETRYDQWVDDVINEVSGNVSDTDIMAGLYVFGWDEAAAYHLNNTKGVIPTDGSGLAVAFSPTRGQLISTFMAAAGVKNESTRIASRYRDTELVYVTPMFHQFNATVSENVAKYYSGEGLVAASVDLFVSRSVSDANSYYQLGSVSFPAVIASSEAVKERLENNWFWQYHEKDSNGYINIDGQSFYCAVIGGYSIFVNPYGMSSWECSLESPLEAYWTACKYRGLYTIDEVKEKANQFYSDFFGVTLSAEQLTSVFGE